MMSTLTPFFSSHPPNIYISHFHSLHLKIRSRSQSRSKMADTDVAPADALPLKLLAVALILLSSAAGVAIPLAGRRRCRDLLRGDSSLFSLIKAFAAGVVLATGFVHILPDAIDSLDDPLLSGGAWARLPFAGCVAMLAALGTLLVDFVGTRFYESKIGCEGSMEPRDGMHVMGIHSHAAGKHGVMRAEEDSSRSRHVVVAQILELGIVSHSVIIGLSLGVSQKPSTIRPLVAALSFHQFFEGFALGGCISQAGFQNLKEILMACFFVITTPGGIGIGIATASFYNPESPTAIVMQGILDSISAGILIYMALVDLIAMDILGRLETSSTSSQVSTYAALFLGAVSMSLLAIWA